MASLRDVIRYVVEHYPDNTDLSKTRLTKIIYLSDWQSAREFERQVTDITWFFDHYGPYVRDVYDQARRDPAVGIDTLTTAFGSPKEIFTIKNVDEIENTPSLLEEEMRIIDDVINQTWDMSFTQFIAYVYDTFPIRTQHRYSTLNLVELAQSEMQEGRDGRN